MKAFMRISIFLATAYSILHGQPPTTINPGSPVASAVVNSNFSGLYNGKPSRWSGSGPPGTLAFSVLGDIYTDTTNHHVYMCFGAGPCTAVGSGNWQQIDITAGVTSFNSRIGAVVPTTGDYTAAQITNSFDITANNSLGSHYQDVTDISTPSNPASGHTKFYTKAGLVCSLDPSGNEKCTGTGGGSVFTGSTALNPAFSATPTFSLADVSVKSPVRFEPGALTANVTAVTFTNKTAGAKFSIAWLQDGTGGRTIAYGASAINTCLISATANAITTQFFEVGADGATVNGTGCSSTDPGITLPGSTSGSLTIVPAAVAGTGSKLTLPGGTTDFSATGGTSQVVKQTSVGAPFTVSQLAASDLTNGVSGSGAVCLASGSACGGGSVSAGGPAMYPFGTMSNSAIAAYSANSVHYYPLTIPPGGYVVSAMNIVMWTSDPGEHLSVSIYDSTCTKVTNGQSTTVTTPGGFDIASVTWSTPPTLAPVGGSNFGWVGISADGAAVIASGNLDGVNGRAGELLNSGLGSTTYLLFTGANAASGTTTHTQPSTCGSRTAIGSGGSQSLPSFGIR